MNAPSGLRSLRRRLPLSYAAIALLAVLALGAALLPALRSYYRAQESAYLAGNAAAIAVELAPLLAAEDRSSLQSQIDGFSFLTQTDVQVYDAAGQTLIAASAEPGSFTPAIAVASEDTAPAGGLDVAELIEDVEISILIEEEEIDLAEGQFSSRRVVTQTSRLPAQGSLYGFELGVAPSGGGARSDLAVQLPIVDEAGDVLGQVRLANGPAYGNAILRSVGWGWAIAGITAVLLAALLGWLYSRRLTRPLDALTAVTGRMAAGDLGARAAVTRQDELGYLGQSFNQMADHVEDTVTALRRFTADAAHELHTPLTALQTDLQLLSAGVDSAQQPRVLRAEEQARRLQDLAERLLELSSLEAQTAAGPLPPLDLTGLVQSAGELYASRAEQVDLDFELQLPSESIRVAADETQAQRALANVLDNSLKFTPPGGAITLSLALEEGTAVVTVRDTGIGIPPDDIDQLFNRFHRGRNVAAYPGSGLGLAIVQEIMTRNNGRVALSSGEWGTEVRLILPHSEAVAT